MLMWFSDFQGQAHGKMGSFPLYSNEALPESGCPLQAHPHPSGHGISDKPRLLSMISVLLWLQHGADTKGPGEQKGPFQDEGWDPKGV